MRRTNRHVPFIFGVVALALAGYLAISVGGFWGILSAAILAMFGVASLKTALFASNQEIRELTGAGPLSEDTKRKFEDRV